MILPSLQEGLLIKRYKRFFADVQLDDGELVTAHCPNTGSMKTLMEEGTRALISRSSNPARKLPFTLEVLRLSDGTLASVNTARTNAQVEEALNLGWVPGISASPLLQREVVSSPRHRMDFCVQTPEGPLWIEVKNVTLVDTANPGRALFPDAVTTRGTKHLNELMRLKSLGERTMMLYLVNRNDCDHFAPAQDIDPTYASALRQAFDAGVEICVLKTEYLFLKGLLQTESRTSLPWELT